MGKDEDFVLCMRELLIVSFTAHLFTLTLYFTLFQKPRLLEKQQENTMCTLLPGQYIFYFCKLNFYKILRLSKQINQSALLSLFSELFQKNSPLLRHFVFHCISNKKFRI